MAYCAHTFNGGKEEMKNIIWALAVALALGASAYLEHDDFEVEAVRYCEMTSMWAQTNGAAGWPPYRGEQCSAASKP